MEYQFSAYTADKKVVTGAIEAVSETMAESMLTDMGYHRVLRLEHTRSRPSFKQLFPSLFKIKNRDIIEFTRELIYLVNAGITVMSALQIIRGMTRKLSFKKTLESLIEQIAGGKSFSQAISLHQNAFSNLYCQVAKAGEEAGNFDESLTYIADYMERREDTKKAVQKAVMYPAILLGVSVIVVILLITLVLPTFVDMVSSLGGELPLLTRIVIAAGDFFGNNAVLIISLMFFLIVAAFAYRMTPTGKRQTDRLLLSMPVTSYFVKIINMSNFCQTAATLIRSGVTLPRTLSICNDIIGNSTIKKSLTAAKEKVMQGKSLSQSLAETDLFPQAAWEMIAVGEKAGKVEAALTTVANYHSQKMERRITNLTSIMEPAMILVVGIIVGIIALTLISTMYSLPSLMG